MCKGSGWAILALFVLILAPLAGIWAQGNDPLPPPADYAEVADLFAERVAAAESAGAAVVGQFLAGEFDALYARLSADAQAAIPIEDIEAAYVQVLMGGMVGERVGYRALPLGQMTLYAAEHVWGSGSIIFTVVFDAAGQISSLDLQPADLLPDDPGAGYQSPVTFRLPFDGLWLTASGGPGLLYNNHAATPPQRHAYDFLVWRDGSTHAGDGAEPEDYYAYGQPVYAPADGVVVRMANDLPDVRPQVETDAAHPEGNHVVLQIGEDAYLLIAHLQPGSVSVAVGETVEAGQMIGRVGNSGNTSEPHIHVHLQDQPELFTYDAAGQVTGFTDAVGLPLNFSNYLANGEAVESGEPLGGQFVQNAP